MMKAHLLFVAAALQLSTVFGFWSNLTPIPWGTTGTKHQIITNWEWCTLNLTYQADLAYQTVFDSGIDLVKGSKWNYYGAGLRFWSNATFIYDLEVMKSYKAKATFAVNLFDIVPYKQVFKFYRPEFAVNESFAFWDA
jgi:hypothetical protein